jgi:tRNA-2-methylthio-N6-dimethylallyladenosine synthase
MRDTMNNVHPLAAIPPVAARTDNNRVVNFAGAPELIGTFVELHITAALPNSLRGELPATSAQAM